MSLNDAYKGQAPLHSWYDGYSGGIRATWVTMATTGACDAGLFEHDHMPDYPKYKDDGALLCPYCHMPERKCGCGYCD